MESASHIDVLFGTKSRIAVLRALRNAEMPLSISEIARRADVTRPSATEALQGFEKLEAVSCMCTAGAKLYALRPENYYTRHLIVPLFEAEDDVRAQIIADLCEQYQDFTVSTVLFGSYARSDYSPDSDIDVALIALDEDRKAQLEDLSADYALVLFEKYGASCFPLIYTQEEARKLPASAPALVRDIATDGVVVCGAHVDMWAA